MSARVFREVPHAGLWKMVTASEFDMGRFLLGGVKTIVKTWNTRNPVLPGLSLGLQTSVGDLRWT
jgi:hypothetical protein